jgi:hypothetical protein
VCCSPLARYRQGFVVTAIVRVIGQGEPRVAQGRAKLRVARDLESAWHRVGAAFRGIRGNLPLGHYLARKVNESLTGSIND